LTPLFFQTFFFLLQSLNLSTLPVTVLHLLLRPISGQDVSWFLGFFSSFAPAAFYPFSLPPTILLLTCLPRFSFPLLAVLFVRVPLFTSPFVLRELPHCIELIFRPGRLALPIPSPATLFGPTSFLPPYYPFPDSSIDILIQSPPPPSLWTPFLNPSTRFFFSLAWTVAVSAHTPPTSPYLKTLPPPTILSTRPLPFFPGGPFA